MIAFWRFVVMVGFLFVDVLTREILAWVFRTCKTILNMDAKNLL